METTPRSRTTKVRRVVRPIYDMVMIRHDKDDERTPGGLILPDRARIPTMTGVVAAVPDRMKENEHDYPFHEGDRVIYDTRASIPCTLESRDRHYLVDCHAILGVVEEEVEEEDPPLTEATRADD